MMSCNQTKAGEKDTPITKDKKDTHDAAFKTHVREHYMYRHFYMTLQGTVWEDTHKAAKQ